MTRYSTTSVTQRWDGKRVYVSTTYPTVLPSPTDIIIFAGESDYLDTLANQYYKDPTLWWIIAMVNKIGKGRLSITPGTQLRIPTDINKILNDLKQLNT